MKESLMLEVQHGGTQRKDLDSLTQLTVPEPTTHESGHIRCKKMEKSRSADQEKCKQDGFLPTNGLVQRDCSERSHGRPDARDSNNQVQVFGLYRWKWLVRVDQLPR